MNDGKIINGPTPRPPRNGFDYFVLAGAAVNVVVILMLFTYWLFH